MTRPALSLELLLDWEPEELSPADEAEAIAMLNELDAERAAEEADEERRDRAHEDLMESFFESICCPPRRY